MYGSSGGKYSSEYWAWYVLVKEMMVPEAFWQMMSGVASPDRLGGKPSTSLAEFVTKGWRRPSKQKLYHVLHGQIELSQFPKLLGERGVQGVLLTGRGGRRVQLLSQMRLTQQLGGGQRCTC